MEASTEIVRRKPVGLAHGCPKFAAYAVQPQRWLSFEPGQHQRSKSVEPHVLLQGRGKNQSKRRGGKQMSKTARSNLVSGHFEIPVQEQQCADSFLLPIPV